MAFLFTIYACGHSWVQRWRHDGTMTLGILIGPGLCVPGTLMAVAFDRDPFDFNVATVVFLTLNFCLVMRVHFWRRPTFELSILIKSLKVEPVLKPSP